jgi:hypothetical protein
MVLLQRNDGGACYDVNGAHCSVTTTHWCSLQCIDIVALLQFTTVWHCNVTLRGVCVVALQFTSWERNNDDRQCLVVLQQWRPLPPPKFIIIIFFYFLATRGEKERKREGEL